MGITVIANRNTTVSAQKTVGEIQLMLASAGVSGTLIEYGPDAIPARIAFQIACNEQKLSFKLPCNWQGVLNALKRERGGISKSLLTPEHAQRVAWRIIKDWLRAQLSLIEAGTSTIQEVMLPWAITTDGTTVSERVFSGGTDFLRLN
jgi:hypothetical protein